MGTVSAIYDYNGGGTVVRGLSRPMTTNGALTASVEGRFSRDTAGRLRTAHWSRASNWGGGHVYGSVTYQHDAAGRRVRATDERNLSWIYAYNSRGELTDAQKTTASGAALPGWANGYAYDDIGNRVLTQTAEGESRTSTANDLNQITSRQGEQSRWLRGRAPVSATVEVRSNLVSDNGTSLTVTREGEVWRSLLPAPPREDWLRANLARVSIQGSSEAELRKVVFTPTQVISTHDADGNLTFDGRWSYEWDGENRLKAMQSGPVARAKNPTNVYLSIEPAVRLEFQYDGLGRRIWKRVLTAPVTFQGQIQTWVEQEKWLYIWQDWRLLGEYRHQPSGSNPGWRLRRSYVWGMDLVSGVYDRQMSESGSALNPAGGVGGLLWCLDYDTTSQTSYRQMAPWYDGNGNILGWIENHAVQVKALRRIEYDPFGRLLTSDPLRKPHPLGSGEDSNYDEFPPFGFSTKFEDVETGLLYYGYRYYDPVNGRWPSRDPIEEVGGINLYGMVGNDTVNQVDVLGLEPQKKILVFLGPNETKGGKFGKDHYIIQWHSVGSSENVVNHVKEGIRRYQDTTKKKCKWNENNLKIIQHSKGTPVSADTIKKEVSKFPNDIIYLATHGIGTTDATGLLLFSHVHNQPGSVIHEYPLGRLYSLAEILGDQDRDLTDLRVACCFNSRLQCSVGNHTIRRVRYSSDPISILDTYRSIRAEVYRQCCIAGGDAVPMGLIDYLSSCRN